MTRDEEISSLKDRCAGYCNGQEQLQSILSGVMDSNAKWAEEVATLKQQVEDMKCCGNCKSFLRENCPKKEQIDEFQTEFPEPNSVCIAWSSDGKTMEGRQK